MADHANAEERAEVERQLLGETKLVIHLLEQAVERTNTGDGEEEYQGRDAVDPAQVPALVVERDNECDQVEAERHDPQEGNDRNLLADVVRRREQHEGGAGGQAQPECPRDKAGWLSMIVAAGRLGSGEAASSP